MLLFVKIKFVIYQIKNLWLINDFICTIIYLYTFMVFWKYITGDYQEPDDFEINNQ